MADTVKTIGSGGDYADPILWSAAEGNVNDGNRAVGELISDVAINALFRPNQTFPNGGLLRGDTALTGEVGIGRTLTNTAGSRVCLSPNPTLEFQDLWISDGGVAKSSTFQNMSGNDFTRVISYDAVTGGTISVIADTTSTTLDNCVFYSIVQGNSSVAGSVTVNNSVIIERMVVRVNNLLTFLNSISLATDWYLGRPTDSGAESLVNYCYIKENANANEFGPGSSNNTLNTDSTSDLVNVALRDYRTKSTSPQATGNASGGLIGAFLEVSGGVTVTTNPIDQAQTIDQVTLTEHSVLTIGGLSQAQTVDQITLQQAGVLSLNNLDQIQTIDQVNLTQAHIVTVNDLSQIQTLEQIVLSAVGVGTIAINDLSQAQVLEQLTLAQLNVVSVDDLSQAQLLDSINFNGVVVGFLQGALTIVSAYNGQIKLTNPLTGEIRIL
jgi:hypothetical protein